MAPAPKSKPANGSTAKGKASTPTTNGTTTPVSVASEKKDTSEVPSVSGGKPDKKAYDIEQERLKGEIDALQVKLVCMFHHSVVFPVAHVVDAIVGCERQNFPCHQRWGG